MAKTALACGTVLDGLGCYHYYGEPERADVAAADRLLRVGVAAAGRRLQAAGCRLQAAGCRLQAAGCRLLRDVPQDATLTDADVELPPGRLVDELRTAQAHR